MEQMNIFEMLYKPFKITKPIRLIEFFAGYGSQALALKYLNANYEHWKICEWNYKSTYAYKNIHMEEDKNDYSKELTREELIEYLYSKGISADWNESMKYEQIKKIPEWELRRIYNSVISTHNLVDISKVGGADLEIVDKEEYCYILTYSFPCQDLSLAGKTQGMKEDSQTRSSLLWQVGRILQELKELNALPQMLLMENVIQVHNQNNIEDFKKWIYQLEKLGYQNYWQDLIGTDYGIPQIRNRTFMVSVLDGYYEFPKPIKLEKRLKDFLEDKVDEKYYISQKQIEEIQQWNAYEKPLETLNRGDKQDLNN